MPEQLTSLPRFLRLAVPHVGLPAAEQRLYYRGTNHDGTKAAFFPPTFSPWPRIPCNVNLADVTEDHASTHQPRITHY